MVGRPPSSWAEFWPPIGCQLCKCMWAALVQCNGEWNTDVTRPCRAWLWQKQTNSAMPGTPEDSEAKTSQFDPRKGILTTSILYHDTRHSGTLGKAGGTGLAWSRANQTCRVRSSSLPHHDCLWWGLCSRLVRLKARQHSLIGQTTWLAAHRQSSWAEFWPPIGCQLCKCMWAALVQCNGEWNTDVTRPCRAWLWQKQTNSAMPETPEDSEAKTSQFDPRKGTLTTSILYHDTRLAFISQAILSCMYWWLGWPACSWYTPTCSYETFFFDERNMKVVWSCLSLRFVKQILSKR